MAYDPITDLAGIVCEHLPSPATCYNDNPPTVPAGASDSVIWMADLVAGEWWRNLTGIPYRNPNLTQDGNGFWKLDFQSFDSGYGQPMGLLTENSISLASSGPQCIGFAGSQIASISFDQSRTIDSSRSSSPYFPDSYLAINTGALNSMQMNSTRVSNTQTTDGLPHAFIATYSGNSTPGWKYFRDGIDITTDTGRDFPFGILDIGCVPGGAFRGWTGSLWGMVAANSCPTGGDLTALTDWLTSLYTVPATGNRRRRVLC